VPIASQTRIIIKKNSDRLYSSTFHKIMLFDIRDGVFTASDIAHRREIK
jgi:hypothetical protein